MSMHEMLNQEPTAGSESNQSWEKRVAEAESHLKAKMGEENWEAFKRELDDPSFMEKVDRDYRRYEREERRSTNYRDAYDELPPEILKIHGRMVRERLAFAWMSGEMSFPNALLLATTETLVRRGRGIIKLGWKVKDNIDEWRDRKSSDETPIDPNLLKLRRG